MKVKSVTIEGMHNVAKTTYTFDDITYLYGPNGAGKSTVIQAIQLALLGYIPGTAKRKSDIFKHANGHALAVTLKILDNDNIVTVSRVWSGTGANLNNSVSIEPESYDIESILNGVELPIFNFSEFLNLSANELKNWFITFMPSSKSEIDWHTKFTEDINTAKISVDDEFIQSTISSACVVDSELSSTESVKKTNEKLKELLSFHQKTLQRIQSTIQSLVYYDDVDEDVTESQIADKIARYEAEKSAHDNATRIAQNNERINKLLETYTKYTADSVEADPEYIKLVSQSDKLTADKSDVDAKIAQLMLESDSIQIKIRDATSVKSEISATILAKQEIINGKGICPYTKLQCNSIKSLIAQYEAEITELNSELTDINNSITELTSQLAEVRQSRDSETANSKSISDKQLEVQKAISNLQSKYREKDMYASQLVDAPEVIVSVVDYAAEIAKLRDIQVKLAANAKYNELVDKLTAEKFEIDSQIAAYKSWIKLTGPNGLQCDDSVEASFSMLGEHVSKYIKTLFGQSVDVKFNLEAKSNSFSFGLTRNDAYIPFNLLSSGEKCIYTLALMLTIIEQSTCPLKLILIDDSLDHLDDINITHMFDSLKAITDVQMIFAGVKSVESEYSVKVGV